MRLQETYLQHTEVERLKVKGYKKISYTDINQKNVGRAILISDKVDFKLKSIVRERAITYIPGRYNSMLIL